MAGILNWALAGLDRLSERGHFIQPASATEFAEELATAGSPTLEFVRAHLEINVCLQITSEKAFEQWQLWCMKTKKKEVGTMSWFCRNLHSTVPSMKTTHPVHPTTRKPETVYEGIGLKDELVYDPSWDVRHDSDRF